MAVGASCSTRNSVLAIAPPAVGGRMAGTTTEQLIIAAQSWLAGMSWLAGAVV